MTGKPVIGVIPYLTTIGLPEEDGLALGTTGKTDSGYAATGKAWKGGDASRPRRPKGGKVKIVIVRLQYIANFTDFDAFLCEPDVDLLYSQHPTDIENADLVIVPGSKNTIKDLAFLKETRLDRSIRNACERGIQILGICGGYQMLGRKLYDPSGIESPRREMRGIGLLDVTTVFEPHKITAQVEAAWTESGRHAMSESLSLPASAFRSPLRGYEIHMGVSEGDIGIFQVSRRSSPEDGQALPVPDGSLNGACWGTYLHGIFDNDLFRRALINSLRAKKGMPPSRQVLRYGEIREQALEKLAHVFSCNLDWNLLDQIVNL
jgi:adenosylcobyric acid synthase